MKHPGVAAALLASLVIATSGCSTATQADTRPSAPAASLRAASGEHTATGPIRPEAWAQTRSTAVQHLLAERFAAAEAGNRAGWLHAVKDKALRREQDDVLARLGAMHAGAFRVLEVTEVVPPVPAPAGSPVRWDVRATLDYRLAGFDSAPRAFTVEVTLQADPARPDAVAITAWRPHDRPQPWDLDGLVVSRSSAALVLVVGPRSRVQEVVRRAAVASRRVKAVLGRAQPSVWIAPATDADAARLLGRQVADLTEVAAATDGPIAPGEPAGADRIVLIPKAWSSLQPEGRDVVMTHELTHATVRRQTTRDVPLWLSEGLAEFVAYDGVALPERDLVGPALARVRRAGLPGALPSDADFDPTAKRLSASYGLSLLAVRSLASREGAPALVRFYLAVAGARPVPTDQLADPELVVDGMLHSILGISRGWLLKAWQARIENDLRPA